MNLPASFIDYTRALLGNEEYEKLAVALQQEPPVSIRLNEKLGALSQNAGAAHSSFFIHHSSFLCFLNKSLCNLYFSLWTGVVFCASFATNR